MAGQAQTPNTHLFPRNEPGTQGHLDLVEPLRVLPRSVADALKGVGEDVLRWRRSDGDWCIKEIVGHLADAAAIYHKRLYMMSTQTDPVLEPYDPDGLAKERSYATREIGDMLVELRDARAITVQLLTTLVNWNWARTGQHLEDGRVSIRQLVEHMVDHEAEHLRDIITLRDAAEAALE
jgi:hypothetical protein